MKALRALLIRTDSMDTRLGCYGENLRRINKTLFESKSNSKPSNSSNSSQLQTSFLQRIDEINFDDLSDDATNRSRSCDDTSFFEILDEVNSSIAHLPEKFVVGRNKRVQIIADPSSGVNDNSNVSTPASINNQTNRPTNRKSSSRHPCEAGTSHSVQTEGTTAAGNASRLRDPPSRTRPNPSSLKVASSGQMSHDQESFYVTPFAPDQDEEEVRKHVCEISNVHSSLVSVVKLVPRGKTSEDLSFVSFKVTVCNSVSNVVGDPWYWPEGITVRTFEPSPKNGGVTRLPIAQ